jgi:hypothetical protein
MYKHIQTLIKKYRALLSAANRLKCGKKVKGSIMATLNRLRGCLRREYKRIVAEFTQFPSVLTLMLNRTLAYQPSMAWILANK